ncbi:MAG: hypothetical protein U0804_16080 [Gemmataceae bacterium]
MGILSVEELHDGRDGSLSEGMERTYTRRFRVRTDTKLVGPLEVVFAPGIPRIGEAYRSFRTNEVDSLSLCRRVAPSQDPGDWFTWLVDAQYDTRGGDPRSIPDNPGQPGSGGGSGQAGDPSLDPPVITYDTQDRDRVLVKDLGDPDSVVVANRTPRPILNSANQPFDPVPTIEDGYTVVTFERNEPALNRGRLNRFRYATNKDAWNGEQPGRWLCRPITASRVFKGGLEFYRFRYTFWLAGEDDPDWDDLELLDQGLCRLGNDNEPVPIMRNGHPVSSPVMLNGGLPLSAADLANPAVGPQYLRFKRRKRVPFAPLNITFD